jgi:hypothetical protein
MGSWYRVSGGEEGPSSGGIVPFASVAQDEAGAADKFSGGRESTTCNPQEVCEIPRIVRSRRSYAGVNP